MTQTVRKKGRVGTNLAEGPILSTLLTFAGPIVLANLVQQLYSMVDLAVIGQFAGNAGTSGVSVGSEVADLIMPLAMGFSSAGQIFIAQLIGAKDERRMKETVGTLISFMLLISVVLSVGTILFVDPILGMLNCPTEALNQARSYMIITALGTPFVFGYNAVCAVLRGMGESKKPLLFICIAATVNIVLDLLLVVVIPMEAAGTAIATTASQLGSFAAAFYFLWKKRDKFDFEMKPNYFRLRIPILKVIMKLGIPQVVRSTLVRASMLWVNTSINAYGDIVVSNTNYVGTKLQKFLEVFMQGVDAASAAMIGQNLGAKKTDRAGKVVLYTLSCTMVCATTSAALCLFAPKQIFGIFTQDEAVKELGVTFLRIMIIHFYASSVVGAFQSMVTGCGFVELGFAIGILDGVLCKIGLSWFFATVMGMGYIGMFWGVACSRILPGILCGAYYFSGKWKTRKLLTE